MKKFVIWSVILFLPILLLFAIRDVIGPFVIALIITYFLHPIVRKLETIKIPRFLSSTIIIFSFFSLIAAFIIFVIPLIYSQFVTAVNAAPTYFAYLKEKVYPILSDFGYEIEQKQLQAIAHKYSDNILNFITNFIENLWSSTIFTVNVISLIFITPVITFYMLRDWPLIKRSIDNLIPRQYYITIKEQILKVDNVLSAYIRGQTQVCILLGLFYATCLYFAGLNYALFIGFMTGILSFIPYVGFGIGFIFGNIVSFYQFDSLSTKILIFLIFIVGQILESAIITPRLIGNNVKLHPVWIIFAIFTGGSLYGFLGVLLAVPIAAVIGVLLRFILEHYFTSTLYGTTDPNKK